MIKVSEIFYSIQGESSYVGLPCVFIRLSGCNLNCRYCDTLYAKQSGMEYSIEDILTKVSVFKSNLVTITGGEPLIQNESPLLIKRLLDDSYCVLLETNGSQDLSKIPSQVIKIMDIKCPDSGVSEQMNWKNIQYINKKDQIKFVISSRADYEFSRMISKEFDLLNQCRILISPAFDLVEPKEVANWILEDHWPVTFQLQQHKYIWNQREPEGLQAILN
jgi:7-carboxy-7-deazaguanine synthase